MQPQTAREWLQHRADVRDATQLGDVVLFATDFAQSPDATPKARTMLRSLRHSILGHFVVPAFEAYCMERAVDTSATRGSGSRILRTRCNRIRGGVDPSTAWAVLERARRVASVGPSHVIQIR